MMASLRQRVYINRRKCRSFIPNPRHSGPPRPSPASPVLELIPLVALEAAHLLSKLKPFTVIRSTTFAMSPKITPGKLPTRGDFQVVRRMARTARKSPAIPDTEVLQADPVFFFESEIETALSRC
ncbi:hypothetical protein PsYK624_129400 [Phanerochaete sordida]|uniref:Uncharacterized protein n=1 Tax=Phanerochaete sordida TaxID=48140 RepID=A0A9P3GM29_9APHY|nr:hypothetical protein PsYK624_129400 [Phanerochaete sordida]